MEVSKIFQKVFQRLAPNEKEFIGPYLSRIYEDRMLFQRILDELPYAVAVINEERKIIIMNNHMKPFISDFREHPRENLLKFQGHVLQQTLDELFQRDVYDMKCQIELTQPSKLQLLWKSMYLASEKDKPSSILIILEDQTDEYLRKQRLFQSEKLALLGTLSAGVAHEIRNPLSTIFIHLDIFEKILQDSSAKDKEEFFEIYDVIRDELTRLNQITSDFLKIARPLKLQIIQCNVNKMMKDLIENMMPTLEQKHITVEFTELNSLLDSVYVDPKNMFQAFYNLVKNAAESITGEGMIRIRTYQQEQYGVVEIADTGAGIKEEHLRKIFEPYFTTKNYGSGLGLMNVYNIIKSHDGEITVDSMPEKGSVFRVFIPWRRRRDNSMPLLD